jgi:hypothetical protein
VSETGDGLFMKLFDDGAIGIILDGHALHFGPVQAEAVRSFFHGLEKNETPKTLLDEARDIVYGDREQTHGEPVRNLAAIASMWTPIFGADVTPEKVCLAMIALKVARAVNNPRHRDHWIDIGGYVALAERCGFVLPNQVIGVT